MASLLAKQVATAGLSMASSTSLAVGGVRNSSFKIWALSFFNSERMRRRHFNRCGFNRYGLYHNDLIYEDDICKEALRRLPDNLQDERTFRLQRALHLSLNKAELPKEEWVSFEEHEEKGGGLLWAEF